MNRLRTVLSNWFPGILCGSVVAGILVSRFPEYLNHWDEFQLAYGVNHFDLTRHHPHPPGYYLFLVAGRLLTLFVGEATIALQFVSALSFGALAAVLCRRLSLRLRGWGGVTFAVVLIGFVALSPILLNYGTVGLTYAAEATTWVALCLAIGRRPTGRRLLWLCFALGLSGGLRQSLPLWGLILIALESVRYRDWISARYLPLMASATVVGVLFWVMPMMYEAGGLRAWYQASDVLFQENIWQKSLVYTGLEGLRARFQMITHLWQGLGALLFVALLLVKARIRGALKELDSLLVGGAIAFFFYGFFIYDTSGYIVSPVLAWGVWIILGSAELSRNRTTLQQGLCGFALIAVIAAFPILPGITEPDGQSPYTAHARHDDVLNDRFEAVRKAALEGKIAPQNTILLTSREYWLYGFRHVAHYLQEFITVQLTVDRFFGVIRKDAPYLVSHHRHVEVAGPDGFALRQLLKGAELQHVVHMVPHDYMEFIDGRCRPYATYLTTANNQKLVVINVRDGMNPRVYRQRLLCENY